MPPVRSPGLDVDRQASSGSNKGAALSDAVTSATSLAEANVFLRWREATYQRQLDLELHPIQQDSQVSLGRLLVAVFELHQRIIEIHD